jgi:hypothetical protein
MFILAVSENDGQPSPASDLEFPAILCAACTGHPRHVFRFFFLDWLNSALLLARLCPRSRNASSIFLTRLGDSAENWPDL